MSPNKTPSPQRTHKTHVYLSNARADVVRAERPTDTRTHRQIGKAWGVHDSTIARISWGTFVDRETGLPRYDGPVTVTTGRPLRGLPLDPKTKAFHRANRKPVAAPAAPTSAAPAGLLRSSSGCLLVAQSDPKSFVPAGMTDAVDRFLTAEYFKRIAGSAMKEFVGKTVQEFIAALSAQAAKSDVPPPPIATQLAIPKFVFSAFGIVVVEGRFLDPNAVMPRLTKAAAPAVIAPVGPTVQDSVRAMRKDLEEIVTDLGVIKNYLLDVAETQARQEKQFMLVTRERVTQTQVQFDQLVRDFGGAGCQALLEKRTNATEAVEAIPHHPGANDL